MRPAPKGVHPERLRRLAREGARFTAQHLRVLSPLRRRATLVATVLDTITRLTDDSVALFDRAVGRMFRRAETRERDALLRDARAINDKVRLLAKLGTALIEARDSGADWQEAVAAAVGWDKLARSVEEANRLARPDKTDLTALAGARLAGTASAGAAVPRSPPFPRRAGRCRDAARSRASACNLRERRPEMAAQPADELSSPGLARSGAGRGRSTDAAESGRRRPCWRCAIGCAPATSGSRAAGNGAPSKTS